MCLAKPRSNPFLQRRTTVTNGFAILVVPVSLVLAFARAGQFAIRVRHSGRT